MTIQGNQKWAILLCQFKSTRGAQPLVRKPRQHFVDLFTNDRTSSLHNYWSNVSHGTINLTGSVVYDWKTLPQTQAALRNLVGSGDRLDAVRIAAEFFATNQGVDFRQFNGILMVTDLNFDLTGTSGRRWKLNDEERDYRVVICSQNHSQTLIAHEMGHSFGLDHSVDTSDVSCDPANDGRPGAYCDVYDIMSAGNVLSAGHAQFGSVGPILNAVNMSLLGWLNEGRVWDWDNHTSGAEVQLVPLSKPRLIGAIAARVGRFVFEYRAVREWDGGIGQDCILVHSEESGQSVIYEGLNGQKSLVQGDVFYVKGSANLPSLTGYIRVTVATINASAQTATLRVDYKPESRFAGFAEVGILHWLIEGVLGVGPKGDIVPVPPRPLTRDILVALTIHELAQYIDDEEERTRLEQTSLEMIIRSAQKQLRG